MLIYVILLFNFVTKPAIMTIDFIGNSAFTMKGTEMLMLFVVSARHVRTWVYVAKRTRGYLVIKNIIYFLNFPLWKPTNITFCQTVREEISFP